MRQAIFATALLAGMIYCGDAASLYGKPIESRDSSVAGAMMEFTTVAKEQSAKEPVDIEIAAIDYCFAGNISDPVTGEIIDLFVLCDEDGPEQNMDLA